MSRTRSHQCHPFCARRICWLNRQESAGNSGVFSSFSNAFRWQIRRARRVCKENPICCQTASRIGSRSGCLLVDPAKRHEPDRPENPIAGCGRKSAGHFCSSRWGLSVVAGCCISGFLCKQNCMTLVAPGPGSSKDPNSIPGVWWRGFAQELAQIRSVRMVQSSCKTL